ncbi:MAG: cation transporter dimerization domain-containing protein, partial [Nitrososphaerales archaeon]
TEVIERDLKANLKEIAEVSVHVESYRPELGSGTVLNKRDIGVEVKRIASKLGKRLAVTKVSNHTTEGKLYIIINCSLDGKLNVEEVHETVSRLEERVGKRFPGCIVTVHSEPK